MYLNRKSNLAMSEKLENALRLYREGILEGKVRKTVTSVTGDRYIQHSTFVKDGAEGFIEFFDDFIKRNPVRDIQIVRTIEDERYVFLHAFQSLNGGETKWVTTDIFDFDEAGKIIEHWDAIAEYVETTASGHTQIDGETEISDLDKTSKNKEIVSAFLTDVMQNGNFQKVPSYISPKIFTQHNAGAADGLEATNTYLKMFRYSGANLVYREIFKLIAQGNFVVSFCKANLGVKEMAIFDIFRLEDNCIVEHWDNMEAVPPRENWVNSGKF
jgi:predicted SnoaL-like aldol condensation-catalyzing enzyme